MNELKNRKGLTMTCASKQKVWTVFDARFKKFMSLDHEEFKNLLLDRPVKIVGRFIKVNPKETVWIDGILNSEWFK